MSDLRELIEATENVTTIDESKAFLQKLEQVDSKAYGCVEQVIKENVCLDKLFLNVSSDEKVRNTFSELTTSWTFGVNEFLKEGRDEFNV